MIISKKQKSPSINTQKPSVTKQTKQNKFYYLNMIFEFTKMFFDMSTIHGFPHISQDGRHPLERVLWILLVTVAACGAGILSSLTLTRYRENPTVISMERDRFSWNTSFPPATICSSKKYDPDKLEKFVNENEDIKNKTLYKDFIISLLEASYLNLDSVIDYEGIDSEDFAKLIYKFSFPLKMDITNSAGNNKFLSVQETYTEMGRCYSYNSQLAIYNSYEYRNNVSWKLLPETEIFYINPLEGEVFVNMINVSSGYKVYFHGPYEVIDMATKNIEVPSGNFLQFYLSALTIFSSERTRSLSVKQRQCRFYYESNLAHFPFYSYAACRMECRIKLAKEFCGCLPHFYRKLEGEKVCDVKGLHCLSKYREDLVFLKNQCSCVANCDETVYVIEFSDQRDWFLGSTLQWGMVEYPKMRLKRDVIFGFSDLLVYIGGMAGLFLGCSVLSFIEIAYFFTLRLFWFVKNFDKRTK